MEQTLTVCRDLYNSFLNDRQWHYDLDKSLLSAYDQMKLIPNLRRRFPELQAVYLWPIRDVAMRVDKAYRAFFRRLKAGEKPGFPRVKRDTYDSFSYWSTGYKIQKGGLYLSKICAKNEQIKMRGYRHIDGVIKIVTIRKQADKWFACLTIEVDYVKPLPQSDLQVGIDLGLKTFAALSDGTFVDNPRFFRKEEKELARVQRRQAKTAKGSAKRRRANKVLARVHERVRNRRHDFVHQTARKIVSKFGTIAVEKLNVKGMVQNYSLAKSISDASWSMFRRVLSYKAESAGRTYVEVNPAYTSQDCHVCGHRAKKALKERWHSCPICGASLDRDTNAAINILAKAIAVG